MAPSISRTSAGRRTRSSPILRALRLAVAALVALSLAACDPQRSGSDAAPGAASSGAPSASSRVSQAPPASSRALAASSARSSPRPSASGAEDDDALTLLRFTFTSNVRDKEPVDKLESAKPGQRVWAHINARNRTGSSREIDLVFRVAGKERSRVPLEIQASWSFRTWGYVTLRDADTSGDVTATIIDDSGEEIAQSRIPIRP